MRLVETGLIALVILLATATAAHATGDTLSLDQSQATWGQPLSLTAIYTSDDKKQNPPRIYNPVVAIECGGWRSSSFLGHKQHDVNLGGDWWEGDFAVGTPTGSGAGTCTAWLEHTDSASVTTILASTQFPID